jgi:ABC-type polysaccharide/polyol phosphate transport system ATPase subunit
MTPIMLEGVGKRYRQTDDRSAIIPGTRRVARQHWALHPMDLAVASGETLGVIGRNGSGKTTLLRLLAGVSAPSAGRLRVTGTIAPLIGVGVGFDAELTGRENVQVNGRILGMTAAEVRRDLDEIVAFAELEAFLDTPVKFYSSGMFLRLAFAVAIHLEPDVLLVDEVLAVGDLAFQLKCFERMAELQAAGTTIVVVTHNLGMLRRLCDRAIVLERGRMVFAGDVDEAVGAYHEHLAGRVAGGGGVTVDLPSHRVTPGEPIRATVRSECEGAARTRLVLSTTHVPVVADVDLPPGHEVTVELRNRLLTGSYTVTALVEDVTGRTIDSSPPIPFFVEAATRALGIVDLDLRLTMGDQAVALTPLRYRAESTAS